MAVSTTSLLLSTAALTAVFHALIPDHWLPFVLIGRARGWNGRTAALVSGTSALIHAALSVALGLAALALSAGAAEAVGETLEETSALGLVLFGLGYAFWAWRNAGHFHPGGGRVHPSAHGCSGEEGDAAEHLHFHADRDLIDRAGWSAWSLAAIIGLNPCVLVLPLLFASAAEGPRTVTLVALGYAVPTIVLMVGLSVGGVVVTGRIRLPGIARHMELVSGLVVAAVGVAYWIIGRPHWTMTVMRRGRTAIAVTGGALAIVAGWLGAPDVARARGDGAAATAPHAPAPADDPRSAAVAAVFDGLDATFVLVEPDTGRRIVVDPERARRRFSPCSTFKIPHALIGLELRILADAATTFRFDAATVKRDPTHSDARWRTLARDHTLRSAVRESVVWYFQALARRIGAAREREWLARLDYGNQDVSAGLERFWLGTSLAISADEQVRFLERLWRGELASAHTTAILKDVLENERTADHVLAAKTGAGTTRDGRKLGWWVGWVERGERVAFFALNLDADDWDTAMGQRIPRGRAALAAAGWLPRPGG
jgi:beta-lactamase class D